MPNWKKVITSGSNAELNDVEINDWGSVSASLAKISGSSASPSTLQQVTSQGNTTSNDVTITGDLYVNKIRRANEVADETKITFSNDQIDFHAGYTHMLRFESVGQDTIVFNDGGGDVDFRIESNDKESAFFIDGENNKVYIGYNEEFPGSVSDTAALNISGSVNIVNNGDISMPGISSLSTEITRLGTFVTSSNGIGFDNVETSGKKPLAFFVGSSGRQIEGIGSEMYYDTSDNVLYVEGLEFINNIDPDVDDPGKRLAYQQGGFVSASAGDGLKGGGITTSSFEFSVGQGNGISVTSTNVGIRNLTHNQISSSNWNYLVNMNQDVATTDNVEFATIKANNLSSGKLVIASTDGQLVTDADLTWVTGTNKLTLTNGSIVTPELTASNGIQVTGDILPTTDNTLSLGSSTQRFQLNGGTPVTVTGSGTVNTITRFNGATEVENSTITNSDTLTTIVHDNDTNDIFIVSGSNGELLKVTDTIGEQLLQVNDGSGITHFEVSSSGTLVAQNLEYSNETFVLTYDSQSGNISFFSSSAITGDNLGDHTATQDLDMSSNAIDNVSNITVQGSIIHDGDTNTYLQFAGNDDFRIVAGGIDVLKATASEIAFNDGQANYDFRVEGDTEANLIFADASTDRVGIGTNTPNKELQVVGDIDADDITIDGWNSVSASLATLTNDAFDGSYTSLTNVPSGLVSQSAQISINSTSGTLTTLGTVTSGDVSGILPSGVVSGSVTSPSQGTLSVNGNNVDLGLQAGDSPTFTNLTLTGDLTVTGTTTELQVSELNVQDKNITVASGAADSSAADGAGLTIDGANESLTWNHANSRFQFSDDLHVDGLMNIGSVSNAGTDTDKFLVLDSNGNVDFRTGNEVRSDIGAGTMTRFVLEDGDGTEVSIDDNKEIKFVEGNSQININWTDTSNGSDSDPYDLTFTITGGVLSGSQQIASEVSGAFTSTSASIASDIESITTGKIAGQGAQDEITFFKSSGAITSSARLALTQDTASGNVLMHQGQFNVINDPSTTGTSAMQILVGSGSSGDVSNPQYDTFIALEQEAATTVGLRVNGTAPTSAQIKMRTDINDAYSIGRLTNPLGANTLRIKPQIIAEGGLSLTGSLTISGSNTLKNIGPAEFSGSIKQQSSEQVAATSDTNKFLVFDGDEVKYRTGDNLRDDLDISTTDDVTFGSVTAEVTASNLQVTTGAESWPSVHHMTAEVIDPATTRGFVPWSSINIIDAGSGKGYGQLPAAFDGYIEKIIVHPTEAGVSGDLSLQLKKNNSNLGSSQTETINASQGVLTTYTFGSSYSFSADDRLSLEVDRVDADRSKGFSFLVVFRYNLTF